MNCQRCGSERVLVTNAKGGDCQNYSLGVIEHQGSAPDITGICDDDYLFPRICLNCGQVQGEFPKEVTPLEKGWDVES